MAHNDTIYWAIKLDGASRAALLAHFPPIHPNVYAEHMTIVYRPPDDINEKLLEECGNKASVNVIGYAEDDKGQAVVVDGPYELIGSIAHITISCANGVGPVYSKNLLQQSWSPVSKGNVVLPYA